MKRFFTGILFLSAAAVLIGFVTACSPWPYAELAPIEASPDLDEPMPEGRTLEVQYIANEGVLISSGGKRVLIDGLHRKYLDDYAFLPDGDRKKIEAALPPFDGIDLILVSHMHGDHFHPESVGQYLRNVPKAVFASSRQVVDELASKFAQYDLIRDRVTPVKYQLNHRESIKLVDIEIEVLGVGHGSGRHASIQNLAHVISIGGKKVLHIGDAVISPEIFDVFDLDKQNIDIALLPAWFLTNRAGQNLVNEHIKPKHIIAVHVGTNETEEVIRQMKQYFPDAQMFVTMLEKRYF